MYNIDAFLKNISHYTKKWYTSRSNTDLDVIYNNINLIEKATNTTCLWRELFYGKQFVFVNTHGEEVSSVLVGLE